MARNLGKVKKTLAAKMVLGKRIKPKNGKNGKNTKMFVDKDNIIDASDVSDHNNNSNNNCLSKKIRKQPGRKKK